MNCKCCNKVVSDIMIFCPYCGNKTDGEIDVFENNRNVQKQMETLYHDGKYQELFKYALEGNILAKFYYVRYIDDMANKGSLLTDREFVNNLKKYMEEGSVFAKTMLGICIYEYKIHFSGITDDWEENKGENLIRESAESDEPSAMVIWSKLLLSGYGIEKDAFTAYKMMKSAANQGYPPAIYTLGLWHCQETAGISKNEELGNELIEKAAFLGDKSAQNYIRKKDSKWLDTELAYAISDEDMKNTMSLILPKGGENDDMIPGCFCEEYGRCKEKEDYIQLYKLLRDKYADDESTNDLLHFLKQLIINITGYSLNTMSIEEAQALEDVTGRITKLADSYELPQHYLHLKEDIKTLEIDIVDEDVPIVMRKISNGLRDKCEKEVDEYIAYSKAKEDAKNDGMGCIMTIAILVAIIGFMFFPVVAWLAIGFISLCILVQLTSKSTFKKISRTNKESYLLVNELLGYGYSLLTDSDLDPKYSYGEYNEKEVYNNSVPSVLSKNTIMETKNKVKGE